MLASPPAHAASYLEQDLGEATSRVERSAADLSASLVAVLKAQTEDSLTPLASSMVEISLSTDPAMQAKAIDAALDAALSLPSDAVAAASKGVKEAFDGIPSSSCDTIPVASSTFSPLLSSDAIASASPAKRKAFVQQWEPVWAAVPKRDAGICLPSPPALEKLARVQRETVGAADKGKVQAASDQARVTLKSLEKGRSFRLYSEYNKQKMAVLTRTPFLERDRFKKAVPAYAEARGYLEEIKRLRAEGPPKCFTIGCTTFYEYRARVIEPNPRSASRSVASSHRMHSAAGQVRHLALQHEG